MQPAPLALMDYVGPANRRSTLRGGDVARGRNRLAARSTRLILAGRERCVLKRRVRGVGIDSTRSSAR